MTGRIDLLIRTARLRPKLAVILLYSSVNKQFRNAKHAAIRYGRTEGVKRSETLELEDQRFDRHRDCAGGLQDFAQINKVEIVERDAVKAKQRILDREVIS